MNQRIKDAEEQMKMIYDSGLTDDKDIINLLKEESSDKKTKKISSLSLEYIKEGNKFPLENYRFGELPMSLQLFLGVEGKACNISNKNSNLCLLRKGVENNSKKSFLACIGSIFLKSKTPSVQGMIELITTKITLDNILFFHKGNIPKIFSRKDYEDIDIQKYENTILYKKLIHEDSNKLKSIISGYESFKIYSR